MIAIDIRDIFLEKLKEYNIDFNDITMCDVKNYVDETTFAPIIFLEVKTIHNDKMQEINVKMSAEMIQDIHAHGRSVKADTETWERDVRRICNLNKILYDKNT